jgi:hypothetical protein
VALNPGLTTISEPWIPQHWVNGSMRYDLKAQWAGREVSESYSFNLAFDPSCAQPPSESGGISPTESSEPVSPTEQATAAASAPPTIKPRETQTSTLTETTTAPVPWATLAPEATPSANR